MISITSKSRKLIIQNITKLITSDYTKYNYAHNEKDEDASIKFKITLVKKYPTLISILNTINMPQDLLNIITEYIIDVMIFACGMTKMYSHNYAFSICTSNVNINFEQYTFGYDIRFDVTDILYDIPRITAKLCDITDNTFVTKHPNCIEFDGECIHSNIAHILTCNRYVTNNVIKAKIDVNYISIFNSYMLKYYNKNTYIDIPCIKVNVLHKIHNHKKMKNMIVIVKLLLYTILGK